MSSETRNQGTSGACGRAEADRENLLARRRFLKGSSLALPAVMTLTPGAAHALTSITCGQKALDSNLTAEHLLIPPSNTDDGHFRLSVSLYDQLVEQTDEQGNTALVPTNTPTYFLGLNDSEPTWRHCVSGEVLGPDQPDDCNPDPDLTYANGFAIVHINAENGEIVAVGSPDNPYNAIITSAAGACMASLVMRASQN